MHAPEDKNSIIDNQRSNLNDNATAEELADTNRFDYKSAVKVT